MISVALATYNGEHYIEKQLVSILKQTCKPDEIIISDDHSTDGTLAVVDRLCKDHASAMEGIRVQIIRNPENQGYIRNFYTALKACKGDIIFLADQDDIWHQRKIAKMSSLMRSYPQIHLLASSFSMIDQNDEPLEDYRKRGTSNQNLLGRVVPENKIAEIYMKELIYHNFCQGCAMAFTAEVKDKFIENFTDEIPHDWQLNLVAAAEGGTYFYNKQLFYYRIHSENTTGMAEGQSLDQKKSSQVRLTVPTQGLKNLQYLQKNYPVYFEEHKELKKRMRFTEKNIHAMQERSFMRLVLQNMNPIYAEMKSFLGRMLDLWYVVKRNA